MSRVAQRVGPTSPGRNVAPRSDSNFSIEKNIPVPRGRNPAPNYPLMEMAPGDSFHIPHEGDLGKKRLAVVQQIRLAVARDARLADRAYLVRVQGEGVRVWRQK